MVDIKSNLMRCPIVGKEIILSILKSWLKIGGTRNRKDKVLTSSIKPMAKALHHMSSVCSTVLENGTQQVYWFIVKHVSLAVKGKPDFITEFMR